MATERKDHLMDIEKFRLTSAIALGLSTAGLSFAAERPGEGPRLVRGGQTVDEAPDRETSALAPDTHDGARANPWA